MLKTIRRSGVLQRGLRVLAIIATPICVALAPLQAVAQETMVSAALNGSEASTGFFSPYLPFPGNSDNALASLSTHVAARDLMIGLMLVICVAMVAGASYLWRENVVHLQADVKRKKRKFFDMN
nr:hypothetical protein [Marinicella sp. W31]MDC2878167.1 hypothetical protein [Marinicella sp. W31]